MENTSYALYIAVGALIGIVILSIVVFRWRQIGSLENAKDETVAVKNKAEFNAEYEAYNKGLMYGSDVLSCLNKAQNNNQKYVYNNYYGTETETMGKESREEFFIDVVVTINSPLKEQIKAYYKTKTGKYERAIGLGVDNDTKSNYGDKVFSSVNGGTNRFKIPMVYYYYFKEGKVYQESKSYSEIMWNYNNVKTATLYKILNDGVEGANSGEINTRFQGGEDVEYHLLAANDVTNSSSLDNKQESAILAAVISTVNLKEQTINNSPQPTATDESDWFYCTWITAASDFKSRKFKCTGVSYNENNGYINKISFEEIK